jgi:uncharacterized protein (DUF1800 family)
MRLYAAQHETGTKKLLSGATLPANQTGERDLQDALDNIAAHPNVAPFISRQLIQKLVTSNPSAAYVDAVRRYAGRIRRDPRAFRVFYARRLIVRTPSGYRRLN